MFSMSFTLSILQHTPVWVWAVLALLVVLGLQQSRPHAVSASRAALLPLAMLGLALFGVLGTFASAGALAAWALAALLATRIGHGGVARGTRWSASEQRFHRPGSWTPLALMLGIFATKFAVGVGLALHPELAHSAAFALLVAAVYGAFSGVFVGRALALRRLRGHHAATGSA